jgi:methyl-accepting chemotaxis protein
MRRLRDWPIAARIGLAVAVPMALFGVALGVAVQGTLSIQHELHGAAQAQRAAALASEQQEAVLRLKVTTREYAARNSAERLQAAREAHAAAAAVIGGEPELNALLAEYWAGFEAIAQRRGAENAARDQGVRAGGSALRSALEAGRAGASPEMADVIDATVIRLMLARDYANRYIETRNPVERDRAQREMAAVAERLGALTPATRAAATPLIERFRTGLDTVSAAGREIATINSERADPASERLIARLEERFRAAQDAARTAERRSEEQASAARAALISGGVLALLLGAAIALLIGRGITRPLADVTAALRRVEKGDLDSPIPHEARRDEVGAIAQALGTFRATARRSRELEEEGRAEHARQAERQEELDQLTGLFGRSVGGVFRRVGTSVDTMGRELGTLAEDATGAVERAGALRATAETTLQGVAQVAAAAEELAASGQEIAARTTGTARVAAEASEAMRDARGRVEALTGSAGRIADVTRMIGTIAARTNLLALNATIEAARAGEAGKGFAIVAGEVKALAAQTARATEEISGQIQAMGAEVQATATAVTHIMDVVARLDADTTAVAAAVEEQGAATRSIAETAAHVASSMREVEEASHVMARSAEATRAACSGASGSAESVRGEAQALSVEVEEFLQAVSGQGRTERFRRVAIRRQARLAMAGREEKVTLTSISAGAALLDSTVSLAPGEPAELLIEGLASAVRVRGAGVENGATVLQFPLDLAQLARMEEAVRRLAAA